MLVDCFLLLQGDTLVQIYHNVIGDVEQRLNKLKVAQIAVAVSSHYVRPPPAFRDTFLVVQTNLKSIYTFESAQH